MKMSEGVEWALHCCVALGWIGKDEIISTSKLADKFGLSPSYLNKCLQSLVRANVLVSTAGQRGGFRLSRSPETISLLEIIDAVEGSDGAFRCTEIRQKGTGAVPMSECKKPCAITSAIRRAENAWRKELKRQTLAEVMSEAPRTANQRTIQWFEMVRA
ncbi:MAG: Rrf2 family transcriptional regulator [Pseudomonadota bacterium]